MKQGLDQCSGPHHLGQQVWNRYRERTGCRHDSHRLAFQPESNDIGKSVLTQVAQPLRNQQQNNGPADCSTDHEQHAIHARAVHQCGNTQKGCRRHEISGYRKPVLQPADAPACCIKI